MLSKAAAMRPSLVRKYASFGPKDVVIVSAVRTPIGSYFGGLSGLSATKLGGIAVKAAVAKAGIDPALVQEAILGNVISSNLGQAPARQAAIFGGLSPSTICTTVNKVCASGTKTITLAAQSITLGINDIIVAGGFESMSNTPFYLDKMRSGSKYGHTQATDGLIKDGLWDVYNDFAMGNCAENCAKKYGISREEQDNYAINSYKRATAAWAEGKFNDEIAPVTIPQRGGAATVISQDEEFKNLKLDKIPSLKPAFIADGSITAANSSKLSDGAAALVLMSGAKASELNLKPIARVVGYADAEQAPIDFPTAPALAIPKAIKNAGLTQSQIDYYEINEAFSVVALANNKVLDLDSSRVNIYGGAVSLGHPLGASGARIVVTLLNVLRKNNGRFGVAGICNGGGGATAIVVESLD